ncbi:MAG: hypothetical protein ACPGEG_10200 [Salibacteraceae bacterium]
MKKETKTGRNVSLLATGVLAVSAVGASASSIDLFETSDLGSAGELRAELLGTEIPTGFLNNTDVELKCGEGKCGEGKCGEAKDGEKKEDAKEAKTKETKKATKADVKKESKDTEHKCGEGKCGEGKCGTH